MSKMRTRSEVIEELADKITSLTSEEQKELLDRVAELNFQKGLDALAMKYRERLAREKRLDEPVDEVLAELKRIRERIAADVYRL